ncbi:Sorting and assembly machinery sam50 protein, partial [Operophtera brumata]
TTHNLQWEGMVRDTAVLSKNTSFKVRESSGEAPFVIHSINHSTTHNLQWEGMVRDTAVLSKNTSFKVRESSGEAPFIIHSINHSTTHNLQWEGMVRDTAVLSKNTSFKVRESSGEAPFIIHSLNHSVIHSMIRRLTTCNGKAWCATQRYSARTPASKYARAAMKSVVRHSVSVDHRDEPIFPTRGAYVQFSSEVCGLGGGVAHLKNELKAQQNLSLTEHIHLFLGGPTTMRGFQQRGVGPHSDGLATGGKAGRGGLGELFRSHVFLNAGCLAMPVRTGRTLPVAQVSVHSCALDVALRLGRAARLEFNYCVPLRGDRAHAGLQFGLGAHFLVHSCALGVALRLGRAVRLELNYCVPLRGDSAHAGMRFGLGAHFL